MSQVKMFRLNVYLNNQTFRRIKSIKRWNYRKCCRKNTYSRKFSRSKWHK